MNHILNPSNFFILFFFISSILIGQAPDTLWTKTFGGLDNEIAYSVDQTTDDGFILVGRANENTGDQDLWLVKTDIDGDTIWTKRLGTNAVQEEGRSVQQTYDGGYVIAGCNGTFIWLLKTDSLGDTLWTKKFGNQTYSKSYDVQQTSDSGYVVVGYTGGISYQARDLFLIKTNSLGDTLWTKVYGATYRDVGYSIKQTFDEGYIITGETVPLNNGQPNIWLLKLDAAGDTLWTQSYNRSTEDIGWSVIHSSDSGFAIVGQTESIATYTDVWLIKTNITGDTLWTKVYDYGQDDNEIGYSVVQTPDDGFTICSEYNANLWLIRTNAIGTIIWNSTLGNYDQILYAMQITNDDGYIVAGSKDIPNNDNDFLLIKFAPDPLLGVKIKYVLKKYELFQNYPNPFNPSTKIKYTLSKSEKVKIEVFNMLGQKIKSLLNKQMPAGLHEIEFNGKDLPSGVYLYRIEAGDLSAGSGRGFQQVRKMILLK